MQVLWKTGKKIDFGNGQPIKASDLCNRVVNICDRGYNLPGDTNLNLYLSLPSDGAEPTLSMGDDYMFFTLGKLRFELYDADTQELLEDFYVSNISRNTTLTTDEFTDKFNCGSSIHFDSVGFYT